MDYRLEQLRFELREDPSSRIFFKLGEHLRREGALDEAIEVLRTGLKQHGRYVAAWVSLGRAQLANGDAESAQQSLERSLQLDPENAVAARAMGEAAIINADWVTAVKALKRARGLLPQDDALDERITFVEARLAELGLLKKPAPPANKRAEAVANNGQGGQSTAEEPFAVQSGGDTGQWDDANDVFAAGQVGAGGVTEDGTADAAEDTPLEIAIDPSDDSGAFVGPPPLTEDDVASMVGTDEPPETAEPAVIVHEEEPHETDDTAAPARAFIAPEPEIGHDTEAEPVFEPVPGPEAAFEPEPVPEPVPEPEPEPEPVFEPEPSPEPFPEPGPAAAVEAEPPPDSWPDPEGDAEPALEKDADGVPLPTMTLARLAIDQGDFDLAERTLRGVLAREPGRSEAAQLLETLIAGPPVGDSAARPRDPADAKAEALQRWLDAVRLASERLKA